MFRGKGKESQVEKPKVMNGRRFYFETGRLVKNDVGRRGVCREVPLLSQRNEAVHPPSAPNVDFFHYTLRSRCGMVTRREEVPRIAGWRPSPFQVEIEHESGCG